ncbi:MAG: hypothetical protein WDA53_00150 [Bacillota bacterium]
MTNLSIRERKLIYLLLLTVGFVFWSRLFFGILLPEYKLLANCLKESPTTGIEIKELENVKQLEVQNLKAGEQELLNIKKQFPQTVSLLLANLGQQAIGRVDILKAERLMIMDEDFYQIALIEMKIRGTIGSLLEYLKDTEARAGVQIQECSFNFSPGNPDLVEGELLLQQVFISNDVNTVLQEPSTLYSPFLPNTLPRAGLNLEETIIFSEEQGRESETKKLSEPEGSQLPSYNFPIL